MAQRAARQKVSIPATSKPAASPPGATPPDAKTSHWRNPLFHFLPAVVLLIVAATHWPALSARALSFDDEQYLVDNTLVHSPGWATAGRFLAEVWHPSTVKGYYQPLAMISLMLDSAMGGSTDNLRPYHRTSLILHVLNTALIAVLLWQLFGNPWAAAVVALLFGLHPLTVEPIPWVGERKTLLATFFALLCLLSYVHAVQRGRRSALILAAVLYVLALMAKPTVTPLPILLFVLDYWPLRRLTFHGVIEKIPFLVLMLIGAAVTYVSQKNAMGVVPVQDHPTGFIPMVLAHNIAFYVGKIVWPSQLSSHYPFPKPLAFSHPAIIRGFIVSVIIVAALLLSLFRTRMWVAAFAFFFIAIFPTLGVVGFTNVIASDKYAYLPLVGVLLPIAALLTRLIQRPNVKQTLVVTVSACAVIAVAEAVTTRYYYQFWETSRQIYERMVDVAPDAAPPHHALANVLSLEGKRDEAIVHYRRAIEINPRYAEARNNLGLRLMEAGDLDGALEQFQLAVQNNADVIESQNNLALVLYRMNRVDDAIRIYQQITREHPDYVEAHFNLGQILRARQQYEAAIAELSETLRLRPNHADARAHLPQVHAEYAVKLAESGRLAEALPHFQRLIEFTPDAVEPRFDLARCLTMLNRPADAAQQYREILQRRPNDPEAMAALAQLEKR